MRRRLRVILRRFRRFTCPPCDSDRGDSVDDCLDELFNDGGTDEVVVNGNNSKKLNSEFTLVPFAIIIFFLSSTDLVLSYPAAVVSYFLTLYLYV